jgi:acyl-CoA thioesterase-1
MDLQYAPRVLASPAYAAMERLIAEVAERNRVGLFRRFEIMHHWLSTAPAGVGTAISADGLHMTDRSYACLASGLADAIAQNWRQYQAEGSPASRLARVLGIVDSGPDEGP